MTHLRSPHSICGAVCQRNIFKNVKSFVWHMADMAKNQKSKLTGREELSKLCGLWPRKYGRDWPSQLRGVEVVVVKDDDDDGRNATEPKGQRHMAKSDPIRR